jgi:hypothetical protein
LTTRFISGHFRAFRYEFFATNNADSIFCKRYFLRKIYLPINFHSRKISTIRAAIFASGIPAIESLLATIAAHFVIHIVVSTSMRAYILASSFCALLSLLASFSQAFAPLKQRH